ncbi:MAG: cation:proton antiporter [Candidatus Heimdallarchaeota archaeon]
MTDALLDYPLLLLGIFLLSGYLASLFFKQFRVPHIVVYLITGFIIANTLLREVSIEVELKEWYLLVESLALGLIGFKIGTELKFSLIKEHPKFIVVVLLAEAGGAFLLVFIAVLTLTGNLIITVVLSGLATATAPAATIEILRKKKAAGPLTTRIQWILAFDDVIAITVVEGVLVYLEVSLGGTATALNILSGLLDEVGIAVLLGLSVGFAMDIILERMDDELEMMELSLAILVFVMGAAIFLGTSVITACMVVGIVSTNRLGDNYAKMSDLLEVVMSPIVMLFFVLVGTRVTFGDFTPFPVLALVYLMARSVGKLAGAYGGTKYTGADPVLRNNLGLGLLAQGGVTIGLVALASDILVEAGETELGHMLIATLIISTIFSVILGSIGTTIAVNRSGEAGKSKIPQRMAHSVIPMDNGEYEVIHNRKKPEGYD